MSVDKNSVLKKLRESDAIYVLMSDCTRMPFVVCDPRRMMMKCLYSFQKKMQCAEDRNS